MAPNKWATEPPAAWFAAHGHRLLRRAEEDGGNFAVRSGNKIKEWVASRDPTGLFVATIIICFVIFISVCALLWETLRKIRKRASGKGWRQLQNDKEERAAFRNPNGGQGMPLGRFYEPRQGQLYDPPRAGASGGGPVMMRQGGMAPPPIPPIPRQYQQGYPQQQQHQQARPTSHPAALEPSGQRPLQPVQTTSASANSDLRDVVYQSTPTPTRENTQMSQSTYLGAESQPNSNRNSLASNDTEPLILPAPPSAPSPAPIPSPPAATSTPVREKSFVGSIASEKAPTIELKRTWTLKSWLPGDKKEEAKAEEKSEGVL
ncbi:hypothetical protein BCR35DRAFT_334952 [Leucosporidium creatinivorum]|uniref:Uncharacterized protein n=1 Tax=Leucosporidium creatinivorum TaxID=106004 RepID=A0A1Y2DPV4_9BASI|nr:hypothetical protein BCR35DRAFT_334952 [Leucosporidium creatinivorum]